MEHRLPGGPICLGQQVSQHLEEFLSHTTPQKVNVISLGLSPKFLVLREASRQTGNIHFYSKKFNTNQNMRENCIIQQKKKTKLHFFLKIKDFPAAYLTFSYSYPQEFDKSKFCFKKISYNLFLKEMWTREVDGKTLNGCKRKSNGLGSTQGSKECKEKRLIPTSLHAGSASSEELSRDRKKSFLSCL